MTLTFALSVRTFIEDIGAYAGFAAVVAVALFALLLFAQAREIKRLRDWGADAHDRIGELERSVAAALDMARRAASAPRAAQTQAPVQQAAPAQPAARGQVARGRPAAAAAATPAGGPARVARTAAPVRPQLLPSAPANVGGPALASATVLIPLPGAPESAAPAQPPVPARPARPAVAAAATGAGARERAVPATAAAAPPRERSADAGANGHHDDPPTELPPRRATPAPTRPTPPRREPARPGARPRPAAAGRPQPGGPGRGGRPAAAEPEPPHGRRRLVGVLIAVLALVVIGVGAFLVLGRGDDEPTRSTQVVQPEGNATRTSRRAARQQQRAPAGPARDTVVVTVLNGTGVTGLASRVMGELTADGYRQGPIGDASDAARGVTVVEYRNNQEAAANEVARVLGLTPDTVSAIRPDSETAACAIQAPEPCTAQVVVTVGADRNPTTTTP